MDAPRTVALAALLAAACHGPAAGPPSTPPVCEMAPRDRWDGAARRYVRLVLALGEHDADYVDAYYGPPELRAEVKAEAKGVAEIRAAAVALREELTQLPAAHEWAEARRNYLDRQLAALIARSKFVEGERLPFDEESRALYDAVSPDFDDAYFAKLLAELEGALPGQGRLVERYEAFRKEFEIPRDKLDAVFAAAIAGCRERTAAHIPLPEGESFTIEYVTDKPWSGYNWYQGHLRSLIQVNTSLPITIDRAIDLACHEGYPGHHVYNALLEKHLVDEGGFVEFTVYPLFSPQSLIAEGSANYGVDLAFPGDVRWQWEKEHVFPLAGLDGARAELYYRVLDLAQKVSYAHNVAAKRYLDGKVDADATVRWLEDFALMTHERALQRLRFMDKYRAYVINYNLGQDLVRRHVEVLAGDDEEARWRVFRELLSSPRLPSDLAR